MKYSGWGAMPNAFAPQPSRDWRSVADELRDLLSAEECASARASTPNAHDTSTEVIQAIWQAMERLGLQPGAIFPGKTVSIHRNFEDSAALVGSEEERLGGFRRIRDELREFLRNFPPVTA